jgi:tRNA (guanine26-N2/guanine27-N2)-dimethyltransferase
MCSYSLLVGVTLELQLVREGSARIYVSRLDRYKTSEREYVPSKAPVFFNPLMKTNRDLVIAFIKTVGGIQGLKLIIGDPLAGVGIRSIRVLKETEWATEAFANDLSERAAHLIAKNSELNGVGSRITVSSSDANVFLAEHSKPGNRFGYVDVDPFGSPGPFLDSAVASVIHKGFLAVTATDTPVLCGIYPEKMRMTYGSFCTRLPFLKEVGIRVLIASVARAAARHEMGVEPLACYGERNYLRAYFRVLRGRPKALHAMQKVGYVGLHGDPPEWRVVSHQDLANSVSTSRLSESVCGPIWTGAYEDPQFTIKLKGFGLGVSPQSDELIYKMSEERSEILGYYPHYLIAKACGGEALQIGEMLTRLRDGGITASRTLFDPTAIKANVPFRELSEILQG